MACVDLVIGYSYSFPKGVFSFVEMLTYLWYWSETLYSKHTGTLLFILYHFFFVSMWVQSQRGLTCHLNGGSVHFMECSSMAICFVWDLLMSSIWGYNGNVILRFKEYVPPKSPRCQILSQHTQWQHYWQIIIKKSVDVFSGKFKKIRVIFQCIFLNVNHVVFFFYNIKELSSRVYLVVSDTRNDLSQPFRSPPWDVKLASPICL